MRDSVTDLGRYPGLHREPKADRNRPRGGPGARAPGKYRGPGRRRPKAIEHG